MYCKGPGEDQPSAGRREPRSRGGPEHWDEVTATLIEEVQHGRSALRLLVRQYFVVPCHSGVTPNCTVEPKPGTGRKVPQKTFCTKLAQGCQDIVHIDYEYRKGD